ncbi:hypothetical protein DFH09DRAFT_1336214 [Mycena vulgaris]|nr:hypothetical protein DFH09DRAFT_1336214 [Mycena vulgaris]
MTISHPSSRRAALPIIDAPERRRRVAEAVDWEDDHQVAVETNCPHPIHCRRRPRSSVWQGYGYTCGVMSTVSLCESDSSADSHSDDSDPTYQPEKNYSQSEETDSAWEQDPSVTIEEVTLNVNDSQPLYGKTRSGMPYAGHPGRNPDDSSSSSNGDRPSKKGSGFTPRKHPGQSERSHKKRRHRNTQQNHHSHGSMSRGKKMCTPDMRPLGQHIEESRGRRIMRLIGDQRLADLKAAEMKRRAEKARILLLQSEES